MCAFPSGRESHTIQRKSPLLLILVGGSFSAWAVVEEVTLQVVGMDCPLCVRGVQESIGRLPGVETVEVNLGSGRVRVVAQDGRSLDLHGIRNRVLRAGFFPAPEPVIIRAVGVVNRGPRERLTFRVLGSGEDYVLLEGAELRRLLMSLPATANTRVAVTGRIHRHPERLPPSLSVLGYEVKKP